MTFYIAYVDETGDTGNVNKRGSSSHYALGCVLVNSDQWADAFDTLVGMRRWMRTTYGLPLRAEVKANFLIRGNGTIKPLGLSLPQRKAIYQNHLHHIYAAESRAFSIVVDKGKHQVEGDACLELAWETLLQRLERTSTAERFKFSVFHDAGEDDAIRRYVRKARQYITAGSHPAFGAGRRVFSTRQIVDDPVPRDSAKSYFIQMADLVAYAGWRWTTPPGANVGRIVPQSMWTELGGATMTKVNMYQDGDGVVRR